MYSQPAYAHITAITSYLDTSLTARYSGALCFAYLMLVCVMCAKPHLSVCDTDGSNDQPNRRSTISGKTESRGGAVGAPVVAAEPAAAAGAAKHRISALSAVCRRSISEGKRAAEVFVSSSTRSPTDHVTERA